MESDGEHLSVDVSVKYDFTESEPPSSDQHRPRNLPRIGGGEGQPYQKQQNQSLRSVPAEENDSR